MHEMAKAPLTRLAALLLPHLSISAPSSSRQPHYQVGASLQFLVDNMLSIQSSVALLAGAAALLSNAGSVSASSSLEFASGSSGRVMWANNCDYYGNDIYSVQAIPDICGDLCADDSSCTHWTWTYYNGGTCWLKSGSSATLTTYYGAGCGYVIDRWGSASASTSTTQQAQQSSTSTTSSGTTYDNGLTADESSQMLALINEYRAENGLSALTIDTRLMAAAMVHSEDQANNCEMTHDGTDGSEPWDRIEAQGYDWTVAAENVAAGQTSVSQVMTSWWNSAGHRANILNSKVTQVGFAVASNSGCSNYATYWTQDFAKEG